MTYLLCSMRDVLTGFGTVLLERNVDTARRNFAYAMVNNDGLSFRPKDYDLYKVGTFDLDKGVITPEPVPVLIVSGVQAVNSSLIGKMEGE